MKTKSFLMIAILAAVVLCSASVANAATESELQAKIAQLMAQFKVLSGHAGENNNINLLPTTTPGTSNPITDATTKIACVGVAVNAREVAIDSAMTTYTSSINSAYSARASALQAAYSTQTTTPTIKAAVKAAWTTFEASIKTARQTWLSSRNSAWASYRTAAVACRAPAGTGDGVDSGLEVSGQ